MTEARLTRITRPLITLGSCSMIGVLFLVALFDGVVGTSMAEKAATAMRAIPDNMWYLVFIATGGYTTVRSIDKYIIAMISRSTQNIPSSDPTP